MKNTILIQIIKDLLKANPKNRKDLQIIIRKSAGQFKIAPPPSVLLLKTYHKLLKNKKIRANITLEKLLQKREIRTLSGVAPIAVLTKPFPCPGKCVYCPTEKAMPKSYLSNEPAVMRAVLTKFDPYIQMRVRIKALEENGHPTDKLEVIVMGGTWSCLPKKYQTWFIKRLFDGANSKTRFSGKKPFLKEKGAANLSQAQKINEKAQHRIIGLTLETRPDFVTREEIKRFRQLGCTKVELGVQCLDDKILKLVQRGHTVKQIVQATKLLKNAGFKIAYHLMPGLPGSTPAKDVLMYKKLFSDSNFQPDYIKIYPTVITKNSILYKWYKAGKYKPYTSKQLFNALLKMKLATPPYVRIIRLIRDIPKESIIAGNKISNLREMLQTELKKQGKTCQCIRCREAKKQITNLKNAKLVIRKYNASGGEEYFISYESKNKKILYAFVRLRIPCSLDADFSPKKYLPELQNAALIRELHTYGELVPLAPNKGKAIQHEGFGKRLMKEAEKIVKKSDYKKIAVIAGVGVREYYKKLGYELKGTYMIKKL